MQEKSAEEFFQLGKAAQTKGEYEKAINYFNKAISINPGYAEAWVGKGYSLLNIKAYKNALECFKEALNIDPKTDFAFSGMAIALLDGHKEISQDVDKTNSQDIDKTNRIDPKSTEAWVYKGFLLQSVGRYDEACNCFDEAIKINFESDLTCLAWAGKGYTLSINGEYESAIECFDEAIKISPNDSLVLYYRACAYSLLYSILEEKEKSLSDLEKAIKLDKKYKDKAKKDESFRVLWNDPIFKKLVE